MDERDQIFVLYTLIILVIGFGSGYILRGFA
jgi:hypothetical protein